MAQFSKEQFLKDISAYRSAIMGLSMIAIILFHQDFVNSFPLNIFKYYGFWGVDVFLLLSGMGLVNSLNKYPIRIFYQRRLLRLVPSCILCGILKCIVILFISSLILLPDRFSHINWLSPFSLDLWYIRAIVVYYLLSPWLFKYLKKNTGLTMTIVISVFLGNELLFRVHDSNSFSWIPERLLVFTIGMLLMVKDNILKPLNMMLSLGTLMIAITIFAVFKGDMFGTTISWTIMIFSLALGTTAIIYLITLLLKIAPISILAPFKWIGTMSLELYLLHEFIFGMINLTTFHWLGNVGRLTISIILSLFLAYLCKMAIRIIIK